MLLLAVLSPLILAFFVPVLHKLLKDKIGWLIGLLPLGLFVWFLTLIPQVAKGEHLSFFYDWLPQIGINLSFYLDGLSLLFCLLITGIGAAVVFYSVFYLSAQERLKNFYVFILLFMGAMLGIVTSSNLIIMYFFWELTTFSSFLLIGFWYEKERSRYGAQKSLLITAAGGFCMLISFILIYSVTGTFEIRELLGMVDILKASSLYVPIVILLLLGAFTKSAQVPFHIWLPDAMEAPTPISCYLHSATMVKAGLYLVARMTCILGGTALWILLISIVGTCSLFFGGYMALKQKDLKGILAYSTISQLGLIMTLLGFGTVEATIAAIFHLFNHATFKGSLFLAVGIVDHETGTRDITKLRGLAKVMPFTAAIAMIGSLSMAGIPLFSGFLSKELFFSASLGALSTSLAGLGWVAYLFPIIAVVASIFTFLYSISLVQRVFFNGAVTDATPKHPHEAPWGMLIPPMLLVSINLIIGFCPNLLSHNILMPAVNAVLNGGLAEPIHIAYWHGFNIPLIMSIIVIGVGLILYTQLDKIKALFAKSPGKISANRFYNWGVPAMMNGAGKLTNWYMTGYLRDYLVYILGFTGLLFFGTVFSQGAFLISFNDLAPIGIFDATLCGIVVVAAFVVLIKAQRLAAILALSVVGYGVSLFFVLFGAPDLALTQLLVETVTMILFLLALDRLPRFLRVRNPNRGKVTVNVLVSVLVGLMAGVVTLLGHSNKLFDSIAWYYLENSATLAGGRNVVNVTLVDFRGFDTMGEIAVLGLASLAVFMLIKLKPEKEGAE